MSDQTDSSQFEKEKSPSASSSALSDSAVLNGIDADCDNAEPSLVKSIRRKSSRDSDSSPSITNKNNPVTLSLRTRMRSRSKSSISEDLKQDKKSEDSPEIITSSLEPSTQPEEPVISLENPTTTTDESNENKLKPENEQAQTVEEPLVRSSNRSKRKKSDLIEPVSPEKEEGKSLNSNEISPVKDVENIVTEESKELDKSQPTTSTPMDIEDDDSSDFFGFFKDEYNDDKYSKFSVALWPYEAKPVISGSKIGTSNGPLEPIVRIAPRLSFRSSPSTKDINDSIYKKPFELGWRRELVFRSTSDNNFKRNADVYYYTPNNKKVRSMREVLDHLPAGCGLSAENFTFCKEVLGIDNPQKEIIRVAKPNKSTVEEGFYTLPVKKSKPKVKLGPKIKEKKDVKSDDLEISPSSSPSTSRGSPLTPRIVMKNSAAVKANNKKIFSKDKKQRKGAGPDDSSALDMEDWSPEPKTQVREVCSIECRLAMGLIPTLQCVKCLCLYHPECVNLLEAKDRQIHSYICKYCQTAAKQVNRPPPPPLTPIVSVQPQKKEKEVLKVISPAAPVIATTTTTTTNTLTTRSQSIVGAVTTWLPPASSIQVNTKVPPPLAPRPELESSPQSLISVQGKKYVVIPKLNRVKLDGRGEGGGGDEVLLSSGVNPTVQNSNPAGVYLVPYNLPSTSGTYVVQTPSSSTPTYIVTSPGSTNSTTTLSNGLKRSASDTGSGSDGSPPAKMSAVSPKSVPTVKTIGLPKQAPKVSPVPKQNSAKSPKPVSTNVPPPTIDFMNVFNAGYTGLLNAFQYLKVHELLRASCVCKMWRHLATHRSLWETVKMKNSRVRNWDGFAKSLRNNCTKCLDLKKMLLPEGSEAVSEMWKSMASALQTIPSLTKIDLGRCTPENLETIAKSCPQLESIVALSIRGQNLDLSMFKGDQLVELKLKSVGGMDVTNFSALKKLTKLKHLSLTSVKKLNGLENCLPIGLETLELGECCIMDEKFATETLPKMINLTRLRLEKGQGCSSLTSQLITAVSGLQKLTQLELINFDIKPGFDKALAKCVHVKTLLIIPTYVTQSATTNHVVIGGVSKLATTLEYFIWGLTIELLRVTDLFIDQVEGQKAHVKKGSGDSIPILKPLSEETAESSKEGQSTSQVDILALPKLQKVLSTLLPSTRVKILKVPFSATWRQTVD